MIVSYGRNFIFFKVQKTGSSSVEENLSKFCFSKDIITPDNHRELGQNEKQGNIVFSKHTRPDKLISTGFMTVEELMSFERIAVCRNPWDKMVSAFWWVKVAIQEAYREVPLSDLWSRVQSEFGMFVHGYLVDGQNARDSEAFYFDAGGQLQISKLLFYERLQEDYNKVCNSLNIPAKPLPLLKNHTRLLPHHYRSYYDSDTRDLVAKEFQLEIETFGYEF